METSSESVLPDNGIFLCKESNQFYCSICTVDALCQDWREHVKNPRHVGTLERFNLVFHKSSKGVACKVCGAELDWEVLKTHATWHRIVPWFEPADRYKTFFKNHMLEWETQFYCFPCDVFFPEWSTAYIHISDKRHQNLLKEHPAVNDFASFTTMEVPYDILVSEGFVSTVDSTTVECTICDCYNIGMKNVAPHVAGLLHSQMKVEFVQSLRDWKDGKSKQPIDHSNIPGPCSQTLPCIYISKQGEDEFCCKICDLEFSSFASVDCHVRGASHMTALKKYGCENIWLKEQGYIYHCSCCDCSVLGIKNVHQHVRGIRHRNSLPNLRNSSEKREISTNNNIPAKEKLTAQPESTTKFGFQLLPNNHIQKLNSREFQCRLCNKVIIDNSSIQEHLNGKTHLLAMQQLSKNIFFKEGNNYHCRCCDCTVPGLENVYRHVNSYRHTKSLNGLEKHKEVVNNKNFMEVGITKQPESATNCRSLPNDTSLPNNHIEKRNSQELYCRLCDETILDDSNVQAHLTGKSHVSGAKQLLENISFMEGNNYHCKCCNCMVPGLENVYGHIKGNRHAKSLNDLTKPKKTASNQNSMEVGASKQTEEILKSVRENVSYDHIIKSSNMISNCKICDCKNLTPSSVDDHVTGKKHVEALKQFSDKISLKKKDKYYCKCCNCTIPGIDNVYTHLQGTRHTSFPKESDKVQGLESTKSFDCIAIEKQIESSKEESKPKSANLKDDFLTDKIPCNICGVSFGCPSDLHSHLAIHVVEDFRPLKEFEDINEIKDNCLAAVQKNRNVTTRSQLTTEIECMEETGLSNHDARASSDCLQINGTSIHTKESDFVNLASSESVPANCTKNPEIKQRSPKKSSMQRIVQLLDFDNDYIHDMRDKLRNIELGMKLCSIMKSNNVYCLICRKEVASTMQNYFNHLSSADHCEYLEGMEKDHALFELVPGQFSEFDLVCQYMEEVSEDTVHCHACDKDVDNIDNALKNHINDEIHQQTCKKWHIKAKQNYEDIKSQLQCDWYDIHKYWCVPCSKDFESELSFAKHLRSTGHAIITREIKNQEKGLIYDFCAPCALLWFGFRCTYVNHCESRTHKMVIWKRHLESQSLPKTVQILLAISEQYIDDTIKYYDELAVRDLEKEETLIRDIEMAVKFKYPDVKAYRFGSKVLGLNSGDSDVEIFLDCGNIYDGKDSSASEVLYLITSVHQCLSKDTQSWDVHTFFANCQSSGLKVRHIATGLSCEISFENGLVVENMKIIKYFTDIFPPCRKLILFLSQWLVLCNLVGPQGIPNHALYWYVIFYLQKESLLPSVASLNAMKNDSHLTAGWEVGVSLGFTYNKTKSSSVSMREFLIRFFTFYTKFDYRYDVACPFLGQEVKKRAFADPQSLPKEMASYIDYMKNSTDSKRFKIECVMCIQDPLNLQRNLTHAVSKAFLSRFREYCSKSLNVLCSS